VHAAVNQFIVSVNVAVSRASRVVAVIDIFDEVCFSTDVKDVARAQKLLCGCILWPIFRSDVADLNNFPLEISTDRVPVISSGTQGMTAR
jgi:hypothetical protein